MNFRGRGTHEFILFMIYSLYCSNNISLSALAFGSKKDNPVYISQESGVIGLNFHQSREVLINDSVNGSTYGVSKTIINKFKLN
jgi:hypothetical protein